jgi:anti-sigma B factor antagonist
MWTLIQTDVLCQAQIEGPMTVHNALALKAHFMEALNTSHGVELDLSAVTEIDAAGLQLLIMAKQEQAHKMRELTLVHHSEAVLEALELMGLVTWFSDPVVITK